MNDSSVRRQEAYLAQLVAGVQCSAWFLDQSQRKIGRHLDGPTSHAHAKDIALFEALAAINERFAKLRDSLAATMRHTALLMGEDSSHFLQVLALFEKLGVLESLRTWQQARLIRNHAAHDYGVSYPGMRSTSMRCTS